MYFSVMLVHNKTNPFPGPFLVTAGGCTLLNFGVINGALRAPSRGPVDLDECLEEKNSKTNIRQLFLSLY